MLVCICNAITEQELRTVARDGISCPEAAYAALGKTPQCRICLDHADDVMAEERASCRRRCPSRPTTSTTGEAWALA